MRLDDNTRAALHYLALGVVVVGLPALLIGLVDARQTADAQAAELLVFRNGYLLGRPGEMTHCMSSRAERIAWAFLLSCLFTIALALLFRPLKRSSLGTRVPALCGAVLLCWGIFVAVARPPLRSWIQDGQLVIEHRPVLFADLTLPWDHPSNASPSRRTIPSSRTALDPIGPWCSCARAQATCLLPAPP